MPKTSALSSDIVLNRNTDFFVFVDTLDTTQGVTGSTKKAAGSAVDVMVWGLSALYNINKIVPLQTVVGAGSANWNAVYSAFLVQAPANASVYTTVNSNSATWGGGSGAGLTLFRELSSITSPNNLVRVAALSAILSGTNVDFALVAKGTGATLAQIPDNTVVGGGKRGQYATDFQKVRNGLAEVAGGIGSVLMGGHYNRATGGFSTTCGGQANSATNTQSFIGGGSTNLAADTNAVVVGGVQNKSIAGAAFIGGGSTNTVSGANAAIVGGTDNIAGGTWSFVGGGQSSIAYGEYSVVVGGSNRAYGDYSFIGGGISNNAHDIRSVVVGGASNTVSGDGSFIGGGLLNQNLSEYSAILGGRSNYTTFRNTFLLGSNLVASAQDYTYVNNLSSQGLVAAFGGNSTQWNSSYNSYTSLSSTFATLSSNGRVTYDQRTLRKRISLGTGGAVLTNAVSADEFDILTTSNLFLSSPSNGYHGQLCVWTVKFGGVHTVSLGNAFRTGNTLTWTSSANRFDKMGATYNAVDDKWDIVSFVANFPG